MTMTTATLPVLGMTCGGCVNAVTRALQALDGVQHVDVSLDAHVAEVTFDELRVNVDVLKQAVEEAGYDTK